MRAGVKLIPIGTTNLPDIMDVEPMGAGDQDCLLEIREVLARHGNLERFGIMLLHNHFPVREDEMLVETADIESRTLVSRPLKKGDKSAASVIETAWQLVSGKAITACRVQCEYDPRKDEHHKVHGLP